MVKKSLTVLFFLVIFTIGGFRPIASELVLTQEEQDYIDQREVIIAASVNGGAPHHYTNSKGQISGIAISTLDRISEITGLLFEYKLYESIQDVFESSPDIIFGLTPNYAPENMILSDSYLKADTILFMNASLKSNELENQIYASIKGGNLPEGVNKEKVIYYNSREETLDAVEKGQAAYGYGNEYSLAFYKLQNAYKNVITIPKSKESREYAIGFPKEDKILLSIINKSINSIDDIQMNNIILEVASRVERKITFSMIVDSYGGIIFLVIILVIGILIWGLVSNIRSKKSLDLQNKRYKLLSHISNECLFEHDLKTKNLNLSEKCEVLFGTGEKLNQISNLLKDIIFLEKSKENMEQIKLPLSNDETGIFKIVSSNIFNNRGKTDFIIGKLIDISEEVAEKNKLITKAQIDGLTGIYNATTSKKLIGESIKNSSGIQKDALMIMDFDNFKDINDNFGHLVGDEILQSLSKVLKYIFRETDIIGRVGGDEFCVYMKNIQDIDVLRLKFGHVNTFIQEFNRDIHISVSGGVAFLNEESTYEELFKKADDELYKAKRKGLGQICIHGENN